MAFIKVQKLKRDNFGHIISGSAAIVKTVYTKNQKFHSKQTVSEKLGKVIYLADDKKSGIFLSPTRGLVEYNVNSDSFSAVNSSDPRISFANLVIQPQIHTVFGDVYLLLEFLEKHGMISVLRSIFPKDSDYHRLLLHIFHGVLRNGSRISCDNFLEKSFASYLFEDVPSSTTHSDTQFFSAMGLDNSRLAFFKAFIKIMQKENPAFGKGCYVDSTPLPNDITDNPFNALCSHGLKGTAMQMRLILVLDEATGLPVWFDIIPGNILDINTVMTVVNDVADTLGIEIDSLILDAGYVSKELIEAFHIGTDKTIIGRMPARRGYPYKSLYWEFKPQIGKGKYEFVRQKHAYFGRKKEVEIFGKKEFCYVYIDQNNALSRFRDYLLENEEDYQEMKDKEKDWMMVKGGYFVLLSNIDTSPSELLGEYFSRTDIEVVFKTSKEYLNLLPLSKWTDQTVRGKILHDIIDTIIVLLLRKEINKAGISISEIVGKAQSLMCFINKAGIVTVETPNKKVKEYYKLFDIEIPSHIRIDKYKDKFR
jgi:hypothetical protein